MASAGLQWGTVGEWVGAVATFLATGLALWITLRESRWREVERLRAAFGEAELLKPVTDVDGASLAGPLVGTWILGNWSASPFFDLNLQGWYFEYGVQLAERPVERIDPHERVAIKTPTLDQPDQLRIPRPEHNMIENRNLIGFVLDFRDLDGRQWRRLELQDPHGVMRGWVYLRRRRRYVDRWGVRALPNRFEHPGPIVPAPKPEPPGEDSQAEVTDEGGAQPGRG